MTSASADLVSASVPSLPFCPLRLRRGWVAGCTDHKGITFHHRRRLSECCLNGERAWLLTDAHETFLAAFFDLGVAQWVRDAVNQSAATSQALKLTSMRPHSAQVLAPSWLHIPVNAWKHISHRNDPSILTTTVLIDGVGHHLKAIQVQMRNSVQCAVAPAADDELRELHAACGASGPFSTVRITGRDYVLTLTPHSR